MSSRYQVMINPSETSFVYDGETGHDLSSIEVCLLLNDMQSVADAAGSLASGWTRKGSTSAKAIELLDALEVLNKNPSERLMDELISAADYLHTRSTDHSHDSFLADAASEYKKAKERYEQSLGARA